MGVIIYSTRIHWASVMYSVLCTKSNKIEQVALNGIKEEELSVLCIIVEFPGRGWGTGQVNGQLNFSVRNFMKCHLMALKEENTSILLLVHEEKTFALCFKFVT